MADLYKLLGAQSTASFVELRTCFKRRALAVHPDKGGSKEAFQAVFAAFEILSDPRSRTKYDNGVLASTCSGGRFTVDQVHSRSKCVRKSQAPGSVTKPAEASMQPEQHPPPGSSKTSFASPKTSQPVQSESEPDVCKSAEAESMTPSDAAAAVHVEWSRKESRILCKLWRLLEKAPSIERRFILTNIVTQNLRLVLEQWALNQKKTAAEQQAAQNQARVSSSTPGDVDENDSSCSSIDNDIVSNAVPELADDDAALALSAEFLEDSSASDADECPEVLMLCAAPYARDECQLHGDRADRPECEEAHVGRGAVPVRGISSWEDGRKGLMKRYYSASVTVGFLEISSTCLRDLDTALDYLVLLTVIKQKTLAHLAACKNNVSFDYARMFPQCLRMAYQSTLTEADPSCRDPAFRFSSKLKKRYWLGRRQLNTPRTCCIDSALSCWQRFAELQCELQDPNTERVGRSLLNRFSPQELVDHWIRFCETFMDAWAPMSEDGKEQQASELQRPLRAGMREEIRARLHMYAEANEAHRDKMMMCWNRQCMAREDRQSRAFARGCRAFSRTESGQRQSLSRQERASKFVASWHQLQVQRLERQKAVAARIAAAKRRRCEAEQHASMKAARAEREARWRQMTRRDITMEEIMGIR